ncbi:hypothetical protein LDENG_00294190 [Lucifuga dentata]|nr:hypothetical protein LDENG_00294190 [Lucifuga dentata]
MTLYKRAGGRCVEENILWIPLLLQVGTCCLIPGLPPSSSTGTSTMNSSGMLHGLLCVGLLSALCHGQASHEVSTEEFREEKLESTADKELVSITQTDKEEEEEVEVEALEALLGSMENQVSTEKRGSIPLCGMGDRCAMKFGPRIGKLCDCGRGSSCNTYLLKCI